MTNNFGYMLFGVIRIKTKKKELFHAYSTVTQHISYLGAAS